MFFFFVKKNQTLIQQLNITIKNVYRVHNLYSSNDIKKKIKITL